MNTDGTEQTPLTQGSAATWSPDSKNIAFHASASGTGLPIRRNEPGAPAPGSDIFVLNVDDVLEGVAVPRNITNSPEAIDDDADWSPDGQKIVFTSRPVTDDRIHSIQAEIYVMNADGGPGAADQQPRRGTGSRLVPGRHAHSVRLQDRSSWATCVKDSMTPENKNSGTD